MLAKKFWIPVLLVLIGVAIGGTFWGKHVGSQEPVRVITPVTPEPVDRSQPTQAETPPAAEGGHWHGDEWHADPHEPVQEVVVPVSNAPEVLSAERLLDLPAETLSDVLVKSYVEKHREQYPDCEDHEAVLVDAKRDAAFYLADREYVEKDRVLHAEWERVHFEEYEELRQRAVEIQNIPYHLSKSERLSIVAELQAWKKKSDALDKRQEALRKEKPVSPPRMHTH